MFFLLRIFRDVIIDITLECAILIVVIKTITIQNKLSEEMSMKIAVIGANGGMEIHIKEPISVLEK